ncbi:hypothetical protein WJX82_000183 [Trebouxia sp. C0006]
MYCEAKHPKQAWRCPASQLVFNRYVENNNLTGTGTFGCGLVEEALLRATPAPTNRISVSYKTSLECPVPQHHNHRNSKANV